MAEQGKTRGMEEMNRCERRTYYLGTGFYMVLDHRDARHRKQWFGHLKRQRPEASP